MKERTAVFINDILKGAIGVYFNTFFVFYFFKVANYEVIPLAKYYLTLYFFTGIGFILIRGAMKKNIKVPYLRIGISLQALYIALIMLLKEKIIDYVYLIAIVKGIADGFYHFPKNIINTEKVTNEDRQKYNGVVNMINKTVAIIVPLILGVLLTYFTYTQIGKVFFIMFIIRFAVSFAIKDKEPVNEKIDMKDFWNNLKQNEKMKKALCIPFLSGLTYSSGVMGLVITLSKINNFHTNLNLGFVDSFCAVLSLVVTTIYALKLKKKGFKITLILAGIISFIVVIAYAFVPTRAMLIAYLVIRYSCILIINLISDLMMANLSNTALKKEHKAEYFLIRDVTYSISRCLGYGVLFAICLTIGMQYINYLMILCGFSILIEAIFVAQLVDESES